ncbi:hypothetical protein Zmor_010916 [Zophobas morio]|uniref:Uncharacterized protein n=1 Tax=Zophobas morio TaxID=2755281 RepID=A0AA38IPD9_9CUCU|nr:hypothetical protein Zmor_010916 [Zophobas morio]
MIRQRHQSTIRVWRSNNLNFIREHSKITHRGRCRRAEFGASGSGCSPIHDGDSSKHCRTALLHYEHAVRAGRYDRKLVVGSRLWTEVDSVTSSQPPLLLF